jgi:hypothetical protein
MERSGGGKCQDQKKYRGLVWWGLVWCGGPDAMPRAHPAAAPLTNPYKLAGMGVYLVLIRLD